MDTMYNDGRILADAGFDPNVDDRDQILRDVKFMKHLYVRDRNLDAGTFIMGSDNADVERPTHEVRRSAGSSTPWAARACPSA